MQFCRTSCIDINTDDISYLERNCLKNCTDKYLSLFDTYRKITNINGYKLGNEPFIFTEKNKENIAKFLKIAELNSENNI
jgi:hypothetical protein